MAYELRGRCLLNNKAVSFAELHGVNVYLLIKENVFGVMLAVSNTARVHCFVCFLLCENFCLYTILRVPRNFFF